MGINITCDICGECIDYLTEGIGYGPKSIDEVSYPTVSGHNRDTSSLVVRTDQGYSISDMDISKHSINKAFYDEKVYVYCNDCDILLAKDFIEVPKKIREYSVSLIRDSIKKIILEKKGFIEKWKKNRQK